MTKDTKTELAELQDAELESANGGRYSPSDPIFWAKAPKRLNLDGGEGNDLLIGGDGADV